MFSRIALGVLTLIATTAGPTIAAPLLSGNGQFSGGNVSIQTQSGTSCSSQTADRASIGVAAGYEDSSTSGDFGGGSGGSGLAAGIYVAMPFGGTISADCNGIVVLEEQRARLDMAMTLFEAGALSADELKEIAEDVKKYVK